MKYTLRRPVSHRKLTPSSLHQKERSYSNVHQPPRQMGAKHKSHTRHSQWKLSKPRQGKSAKTKAIPPNFSMSITIEPCSVSDISAQHAAPLQHHHHQT